MVWVLAAVGVVGVVLVGRVDNWRRDFSTNVASTRDDPHLAPLRLGGDVAQAVQRLKQVVAEMPHWQWVESTQTPGDPGAVSVHLIRSTRLLRFKDDVHVTIERAGKDEVVMHVQSRSRLGKGDLGQNPRNIKELLQRVQDADD